MPCVLAIPNSLLIGIPNHLFGILCWVYGIYWNSAFALFYALEVHQVHLVDLLRGDYWRPMTELPSPMVVMSEGLGFNLCVAPFLNVCVLITSEGQEWRMSEVVGVGSEVLY